MMVVVVLPGLHLLAHVVHRDELVDVQELVAQPAVERLDQPVVGGLAWARVVELDAAPIRPIVQSLGGELGAVVHSDRLGQAPLVRGPVQRLADAPSRQSVVGLQHHALATPLIDCGQDAELASVEHLVVHEVHAPVLVCTIGRCDLAAQQRDALAPPDLQAQLQPFEAVQPVDALLAHGPALALEHDQHAQVPESRSAHGDVSDALAQSALIARLALGVPHRTLQ